MKRLFQIREQRVQRSRGGKQGCVFGDSSFHRAAVKKKGSQTWWPETTGIHFLSLGARVKSQCGRVALPAEAPGAEFSLASSRA